MVKTYERGSTLQLAANFKAREFDCKGGECAQTLIDTDLVNYLQKIRDHFQKAVHITSGYRCPTHNKRVGGATNSYHTKGQAADFYIDGVEPLEIAKYAESLGCLGIGQYPNFVHIDTRTKKFFWYGSNEEARTTFGGKAPEASTTPAQASTYTKTWGIDISRWQGDYNLTQAKAEGVKFVIVKGGGGDDGLYKDSQFENNYKKAKNLGLPVGCYWFSKATTIAEAVKEAEYFYNNCLKGKQFELPVYMDVENKSMLNVGKANLTAIIKAFCDYLEEKEAWVGIYSSLSYFSSYMNDKDLQSYAHWVACWGNSCNYPYPNSFGMWQFGGETNKIRSNKVAGQVTDQNYMLVDYPAMIKERGKNNFTTGEAPKQEEPKVETPKQEAPVVDNTDILKLVDQAQELLDQIENKLK